MKKLKISFYFIALVCLCSCTAKISQYHAGNRYLQNFNTHIINDSLNLHLVTPADLKYLVSEKAIRQDLKEKKISVANPIWLYGTTNDPSYQLLVTIGNRNERARKNQLLLDTIIDQKSLHFIGVNASIKSQVSMEADVRSIYHRIKSGKDYLQDTGSVMSVVNRSMTANTYLKQITEIGQYPIPPNQGNSLELQMQLTFASFLQGNPRYHELIAQIEKAFKGKDSVVNRIHLNTVVNARAIDSIVAQAKLTNVVMINENHFYPAHRSFVLELLPRLRAAGYTHLALEALAAPQDSLLNRPNSFPTLSTGFYTREQTYGNLLREAKKLGFTFVAYENEIPGKDREVGQAENLYRKTIGTDRKAKVLVLAGIDHIIEQPTTYGKKWMATHFKELYGINPITISQTHLNLYRGQNKAKYQLIGRTELAGISNIAAVDYFLLNNSVDLPPLWNQELDYKNSFDHVVQVSLFYKKEMKGERDFHRHIPYFTALVPAGGSMKIPYSLVEPAVLVVYNKLGNVLTVQNLNK
ncbi:MAG: hypothetical protein ACQUHE_02495 [Bacteroidia bacterium]